jgi:hypothetical protein
MKFKNKFSQFLESFINPVNQYHDRFNDILIKYETEKNMSPNALDLMALYAKKKILDNFFVYKSILNIHYAQFNFKYSIIDNNVSTIYPLYALQSGVRISPELIKSSIDLGGDYYLKIENTPKQITLRQLDYEIGKVQLKLENTITKTQLNPEKAGDYKEEIEQYTNTLKSLQEHSDILKSNIETNMARIGIMFRIKYPDSNFNVTIMDKLQKFDNNIKSGSHIDMNDWGRKQQFYMFNYINATDETYFKYFLGESNMGTGNLFPFLYANFLHVQAPIMANYLDNMIPITLDLWDLANQNGVILGTSGSGKSTTSKAILTRNYIFENVRIIVIDPQGEYLYTTKMVGGEFVNIQEKTAKAGFSVNIFDKAEYESVGKGNMEFGLKIGDIAKFISLVSRPGKDQDNKWIQSDLETKPLYSEFLKSLIYDFYMSKGIMNMDDLDKKEAPILEDFLSYVDEILLNFTQSQVLKLYGSSYDKNSPLFGDYLEAFKLVASASKTMKSFEYGIFKGKTNVDFKNRFLVFNTSGLQEKFKALATYVIMNFVIKSMFSDKDEKRLFLIDEGWDVLGSLDSEYITTIAKTARKFNMGLIITTQSINDFMDKKGGILAQGAALLDNSQFAYLFQLMGNDATNTEISSRFLLTPGDISFLKNLDKNQKGVGILKWGATTKYRIRFLLTDDERNFAESDIKKLIYIIPNEIVQTRKKLKDLQETRDNKDKLHQDTKYETELMDYYNKILSSLRDIKSDFERSNSNNGFRYDEENVRQPVIDDHGIYSYDVLGKKYFGEGINQDEVFYLLNYNDYSTYESKDELFEIFGNEVFAIKTSLLNKNIYVYNKFLESLIKSQYNDKLVGGNIIFDQNDIIFKIKIAKEIGKYYVYYPDYDGKNTEKYYIWNVGKSGITITEASHKEDYFKNELINKKFIYIYDINSGRKLSYPKEQENIAKEKIAFDEMKITIRTQYDYLTPFAQKTKIPGSKISEYYVLFKDLHDRILKSSGDVGLSNDYYRYDKFQDLLKNIFE